MRNCYVISEVKAHTGKIACLNDQVLLLNFTTEIFTTRVNVAFGMKIIDFEKDTNSNHKSKLNELLKQRNQLCFIIKTISISTIIESTIFSHILLLISLPFLFCR